MYLQSVLPYTEVIKLNVTSVQSLVNLTVVIGSVNQICHTTTDTVPEKELIIEGSSY